MKYNLIYIVTLIIFVSISLVGAQEDYFPVIKGPYLGQEPPGDTPIVFAPGIVSTGKEHSAAMFTPDGNELWFGRLFPATVYYMKSTGGTWDYPQIGSFCDTTTNSLYPVLSPDGNRIYFSSDRAIDQTGEKLPKGDYHIWIAEKKAGIWSGPIHLDNQINFGRRQSCGSISMNGDLYFVSFVNQQSMNLFCSKMINGTYDYPEELNNLNSTSPDHSPFIGHDGTYIIFSSFRGGLGRSDLYISYRLSDSTWSEPMNMGSEINSEFKDEYPYVTPDGKYMFFNSNRPSSLNKNAIEDGPGNIYWVSSGIIDRLRPEN